VRPAGLVCPQLEPTGPNRSGRQALAVPNERYDRRLGRLRRVRPQECRDQLSHALQYGQSVVPAVGQPASDLQGVPAVVLFNCYGSRLISGLS
jgi:hypothetical protein